MSPSLDLAAAWKFHNFLGESISNRKIVGLFEDFVSQP